MANKAFPDAIDNTIRTSVSTCMTQAKYGYIENLSSPGDSVHLHFGACLAHGLETVRRAFHDDGLSPERAVEQGAEAARVMYGDFDPPAKSPKTRDAVGEAVRFYFSKWPVANDIIQPIRLNDGKLAVEWKFKVEIPDLIHPDHGGPIYYVGRSDMIGERYGRRVIVDDKSASQLGEKWANNFTLDSQGIGYAWAGQQVGLFPPDSSVDVLFRGVGIYTPKFTKPGTDTYLKKVTQEKIEAGEAIYRPDLSFGAAQSPVTETPWLIDRWLRQLKRDIGRLIYSYENDEWDLALTKHACAGFNGCPYQVLCMSKHPDEWKAINFIQRKWNPLDDV